jgi:hypothetical protein
MSIPPWIVAIVILVAACFIGVSIVNSVRLFPNEKPASASASAEDASGAAAEQPKRHTIAIDEYFEDATGSAGAEYHMKNGLDQNIASNQPPLAYSVATDDLDIDKNKPLQDMMQGIRSKIGTSSIMPTSNNLALISGGSSEPATEKMVQEYKPNQDRIAPHQQIPTRKSQVVANAPTDIGTEAEQIQSNSSTRSIRENIREEAPLKEENFMNPFSISYPKI